MHTIIYSLLLFLSSTFSGWLNSCSCVLAKSEDCIRIGFVLAEKKQERMVACVQVTVRRYSVRLPMILVVHFSLAYAIMRWFFICLLILYILIGTSKLYIHIRLVMIRSSQLPDLQPLNIDVHN